MRTVVTRDVEWDDTERAKMLALAAYEASLCACGFPEHLADEDPDLRLTVRVCPVCAGLAKAARIQSKSDQAAVAALGKTPAPEAERPTDGRHIGLEPKPPAETDDDQDEPERR